MLSSEAEDRLMAEDAMRERVSEKYEEEIERCHSIINSFFETYKKYGFVSPDNNIELRTMVMLNHTL